MKKLFQIIAGVALALSLSACASQYPRIALPREDDAAFHTAVTNAIPRGADVKFALRVLDDNSFDGAHQDRCDLSPTFGPCWRYYRTKSGILRRFWWNVWIKDDGTGKVNAIESSAGGWRFFVDGI